MRLSLLALALAVLPAAPAAAQLATAARLNADYGIGAAGGLMTSSTFEDDIVTGTHRAVTVSVPFFRSSGPGNFAEGTVGVRVGYSQVIDEGDDRTIGAPAVYLEGSLSTGRPVSPWITAEMGYDVYNFNTHGWVLGLVPTFGAGAGVLVNAGNAQIGLAMGGSVTSLFEGASAYLRGSAAVRF